MTCAETGGVFAEAYEDITVDYEGEDYSTDSMPLQDFLGHFEQQCEDHVAECCERWREWHDNT